VGLGYVVIADELEGAVKGPDPPRAISGRGGGGAVEAAQKTRVRTRQECL